MKKILETNQKDFGYSFMETLITLAITIIISAGIGIPAVKYIEKAKILSCKTQIENFKIALNTYYLDCGLYPETEQGLEALYEKPILSPIPDDWDGPYISSRATKDPWGNNWEYTKNSNGKNGYEIRSFGKDRVRGGVNNDDITSEL